MPADFHQLAGVEQQLVLRRQLFFLVLPQSGGLDFIHLVLQEIQQALPFALIAVQAG